MGSGQKACEEDYERQAFLAHKKRLEELGYGKIINIVDDLQTDMRLFEQSIPAMSRSGWSSLDRIKKLLDKLS